MARSSIGDRNILDKAIKTSKKYEGARSTLDTGNNVLNTKAPEKLQEKRALEHFKRIKPRSLYKLLSSEDVEEKVLLIDIRDKEDYEDNRITGALHYPPLMLCRSTNPLLPEMFAFKNKEKHLIVAYDMDDTITLRVANRLFEKGIDNIYVLTGGLQEYVREHAHHILGTPPPPGPAADTRPLRVVSDASSTCSSRMGQVGNGTMVSRASTISNASSHKPKSLSSSISRANSSNWR